jgi:type I restriction enzyme S subunit
VALGEVAETALGKMLDKGRPRGHAHVPYLRNVNVQWGRIDTGDLLTMELAENERERFGVRRGDLLVCEGGVIGRCAIWHGREDYLAFQKALHRVRPGDTVDARFLRYLLEHHSVSGVLAALSTGTTIAHLPQQQLRRVPVPLPSLEEQRQIVDLLEDHLSRLDAAQQALTDSFRRLSALRDTFLSKSVAQAHASAGVVVRSLGSVSKVSSGLTPLKGNKAFFEGGTIPWITSGDLHQGLITRAKHFVTQTALDETTLKVVPAGALLIAMYGEGKTRGTAAELGIDATTNQACAAVVLLDRRLRGWVRLVLDANYSKLRRLAAGGVQPNLNLSVVGAIQIPIPSSDVRERLLGSRAELDDAQARLTAQLEKAQRRGASLRRAVLAAAFSGRLTAADADLSNVEATVAA